MSPEPLSDAAIAKAAERLAGWLQFRLHSGAPSLKDALESGLPGPIRGKESFFERLAGSKRIANLPEADLAAKIAAAPWFCQSGAESVRHWRHRTQAREMTARWEGLPMLATAGDLCRWLGGLRPGELRWLAQLDRGQTAVAFRLPSSLKKLRSPNESPPVPPHSRCVCRA